jgi:cysteinyl-tRNA synthetase
LRDIGNFSTFLFEDLLRRWLEASGYEVFQIMNLTDVDDRIISEAGKSGTDIDAFVAPYIVAFNEDREWLRIRAAHAQPRATSFVPAMVRLWWKGSVKGVAYKGEDGSVYFSIERFPAYGRLSQLDKREPPHRRERPGGERRVRQGGRPRLRALEGGPAAGRGGGCGVDARSAAGGRLASRVLDNGARPRGEKQASTCSTSTPAA